jgi:hypothetical protein
MLDDEKKKLIETEERYRHEIASKLPSDMASVEQSVLQLENSLWGKVYEILNSNIGIWLLSSIFISGGAALYQITQHHYETEAANRKELITCEFEIVNRLNSMRFLLLKAKTMGDAQNALTPINKSFGAVSIEYEHVNIAALFFKTFQLTGNISRKVEESVLELEEKNLVIQGANPKASFNDIDRKRLLEIIDTLYIHEKKQIDNRKLITG